MEIFKTKVVIIFSEEITVNALVLGEKGESQM